MVAEEPRAPDGTVSACVDAAVELLRTRAYYTGRVDWPVIMHNVADAVARGASVGQALALVWPALGDRHSHFRPAPTGDPTDMVAIELPTGHVAEDGLGHLRLPGFAGGPRSDAMTDYVTAAWDVLRTPASGWVIDLRGNGGGSVVPMLTAVGPLLGTGGWLSFQRRDGTSSTYHYEAGGLSIGTSRYEAGPHPPDDPGTPVALVSDRRTASAAEIVVVAFRGRARTRFFGTLTAGIPTGNVGHRLPDGSRLFITESLARDRDGRLYDGPLSPDEEGELAAAAVWTVAESASAER